MCTSRFLPLRHASSLLAISAGYKITSPLPQFLEIQCANFERVFYVLGNHEFYGSTREHGLERAMHLQREPRLRTRLTILNRSRVDVTDDLTILGCTLQSHITPACEQIVKSKIQDFRKIANWTTANHNDEHRRDLAWLKAQVEEIRDSEQDGNSRTIIAITHHAPIRKGSSRTEHEENPWTDAFATELLDMPGSEASHPLTSVDW